MAISSTGALLVLVLVVVVTKVVAAEAVVEAIMDGEEDEIVVEAEVVFTEVVGWETTARTRVGSCCCVEMETDDLELYGCSCCDGCGNCCGCAITTAAEVDGCGCCCTDFCGEITIVVGVETSCCCRDICCCEVIVDEEAGSEFVEGSWFVTID